MSLRLLPRASLGVRLDAFESLARELFGDAVTVSAETRDAHDPVFDKIEVKVSIDLAREFPAFQEGARVVRPSPEPAGEIPTTPRGAAPSASSTPQRDGETEGGHLQGPTTTSSSEVGGPTPAVDLGQTNEPPLVDLPRAAEESSQPGAHGAFRGLGAASVATHEARSGAAPSSPFDPERVRRSREEIERGEYVTLDEWKALADAERRLIDVAMAFPYHRKRDAPDRIDLDDAIDALEDARAAMGAHGRAARAVREGQNEQNTAGTGVDLDANPPPDRTGDGESKDCEPPCGASSPPAFARETPREWSEEQREAVRNIVDRANPYQPISWLSDEMIERGCAEIAKHAHLFASPPPETRTDVVLQDVPVDAGPLANAQIAEMHRLLAPVLDASGFSPAHEKASTAIARLLAQWRSGLEPRVPPAQPPKRETDKDFESKLFEVVLAALVQAKEAGESRAHHVTEAIASLVSEHVARVQAESDRSYAALRDTAGKCEEEVSRLKAECERLRAERDEAHRLAGEALGTDPEYHNAGCVAALAQAYDNARARAEAAEKAKDACAKGQHAAQQALENCKADLRREHERVVDLSAKLEEATRKPDPHALTLDDAMHTSRAPAVGRGVTAEDLWNAVSEKLDTGMLFTFTWGTFASLQAGDRALLESAASRLNASLGHASPSAPTPGAER